MGPHPSMYETSASSDRFIRTGRQNLSLIQLSASRANETDVAVLHVQCTKIKTFGTEIKSALYSRAIKFK